jgi:transcriptional regulator with XRE-family HTH domain
MLFGEKILLLRKFVGLLQKELAELIGVSESRVSEYENDVYAPSPEMLALIASKCNMHIGYFFDNIPPSDYYQVGKDLKYAYYLSQLPDDVRRFQRKMLRHAYKVQLNDVDKVSKNILQATEQDKRSRNKKIKPFHEDYFKELRKRSTPPAQTTSITDTPPPAAVRSAVKGSATGKSRETRDRNRNIQ